MADIIVIDDDPNILTVLYNMLVKGGHTVRIAHDGNEGVRLFSERRADLIVTDIIMPEKDGMETILDIRRKDRTVKIIAISGGADFVPDHYLDTAQLFGAHRILEKPFSLDQLLCVVEDLLGSEAISS